MWSEGVARLMMHDRPTKNKKQNKWLKANFSNSSKKALPRASGTTVNNTLDYSDENPDRKWQKKPSTKIQNVNFHLQKTGRIHTKYMHIQQMSPSR